MAHGRKRLLTPGREEEVKSSVHTLAKSSLQSNPWECHRPLAPGDVKNPVGGEEEMGGKGRGG